MSFRLKLKNKIIAILFAIVPALLVGSLVFGANVYFDLDSSSIKTYQASEFISTSTTDLNKTVDISQTGATTGTDYGLYVTNTGASTTNIGGYFSATGATNNYGLIVENGNVGIGLTAPTAYLHLKAGGTSAAGTAPLKLTSSGSGATDGIDVTEAGAIEFFNGHLWFTATDAGPRLQIDQQTGSVYTSGNDIVVDTDKTIDIEPTLNFVTTIQQSAVDADLTLAALGGGTNQVIINSEGTSNTLAPVDINANGTVAGNAITLDTIDGGIALTAAGAANGDINLTVGDDFTLNGVATSVLNIGTSNVAQQINIGTGTDIDTINIGTGATGVDIIRIGQAAADLALTDAHWSIATDGSIRTNSSIGILESGLTPTYYTIFQGGDQTAAANITYTLPTALPDGDKILQSTNAGVLSWVSPSAGTVINVGSMVGVGTAFGGTAADTHWLGLGSGAGRIAFNLNGTDHTVALMDSVSILDANIITSSDGSIAIGNINGHLIDDMDSAVEDTEWVESDSLDNTNVSTEATYIREGEGAMKITTVDGSSDSDYVRKTLTANESWATYERVGFWIRASQTGQIISFSFYDENSTTTSTHAVTISEANQWQYEEYNIAGIISTSKDDVDWVQFSINEDANSPTFYIDQLRAYNFDERSSEMFVDNEGNLVVWGRGGVEIGRGVPGSSLSGMNIGSANIELNQPLNVNVAGDTGMAYDLQFLNTGGSNITSLGALMISAGDPNKTQNLTLTTQSNQISGDSGVATAGANGTITDSSKSWTTNEWANGVVYIISGTGYGQERTISSNTGTEITVSSNWTTNPDTTSSYRLAYQQGGDVVVDVQNSSNNYGGFKVAGIDNGSYVFRIGSDGNVEIGGNGSAGSNLTVKQNISLTGGNITISKLATPTGVVVTPMGTTGATTYGYRISAVNNNGETLAATTVTTTTGNATLSASNYNQITWNTVSGATAYKIYGRTDSAELYMATMNAPGLVFNDTGTLTPSGALPTSNTTGGDIAGILSFSDVGTTLTLATDAITVTQTYHTVDEEGTAADNLSTINGGTAGDVLVLRGFDTDYVVTAKDGTGNLKLTGDFAFTSISDTLTLLFNGTNWLEIARATSGADIAESYFTYDLATEAGDVVAVSSQKGEEELNEKRNYFIEKTSKAYSSGIFGVVSTNPYTTMGGGYGKITDEAGNIVAETRSIALAGRVPTKVNLEGGKIAVGDYLTSSSVIGEAMKATKAGRIIGQALEPFDGNITECGFEIVKMETENDKERIEDEVILNKEKETVRAINCRKVPSKTGKTMTFIQPGWYEGAGVTVEWNTQGGETVSGVLSSLASSVKSGAEELGAIIDNGYLKVKSIFAEDIATKKLCLEGEDGERICVEKDQLKALLSSSNITPASTPIPVATSTPVPTPTLTATPVPTPTLTATPVPTPTLTATPVPTPTPEPTPLPTVPTIIVSISEINSGAAVNGVKVLEAASDLPLTAVNFVLDNTDTAISSVYVLSGEKTDDTARYWSASFNTNKVNDGNYNIIAKGLYNGVNYENTVAYSVNVQNVVATPTPEPTPTPTPKPKPTPRATPKATPEPTPEITPAPEPTPEITPVPEPTPEVVLEPEVTPVPSEAAGVELFDITMNIENDLLNKSSDLVARTQFISFGNVPTPVDLAYRIEDAGGKEVYAGKDEVTVETERMVVKKFTGLNIGEGKYTLILETTYGANVKDEFRQSFEVKAAAGPDKGLITIVWIVMIVNLTAMAVFAVYKLIGYWKRR